MRMTRWILSGGLSSLVVVIGLAVLAQPAMADPTTPAGTLAKPQAATPAVKPTSPPTSAPADEGNAEAIKLYARGQYAEVIKLLDPVFAAGKAKIQERLLLARALLHTNQQDGGLKVLESVLKTDSENPEANHLAGLVWFQRGKFKQAVELLQHAYRLKKDPSIASTLGQCYYGLGETAKAKELLQAALKEDIRNPTNSFLLAKICLANGSGAQAERFGLLALEAGMDTTELHHLLGQAYMLQRKYVGPILVKRIPGNPKPGDVVDENIVLAKVEGVEDQYKVCTKYCALYEGLKLCAANDAKPQPKKTASLTQPDKTTLTLNSPNAYAGKDILICLTPGTLQEFGFGLEPMHAANFIVASGWFAAGQYALAEKYLRRIEDIQLFPRQPLELAAKLAIATKDFAALEGTLSLALVYKVFDPPTVADFYYQAASVLRADGKRAEALAMLKKADAAVPTSAKVLRALASLSQVTGKLDDARQYYARIVELFPDAADIDELRNTLKALAAHVEKTGDAHGTTLPDDAFDDKDQPTRLPANVPDVPLPR